MSGLAHHKDRPAMLPGDWADDAACLHVDPDIMYPDKGGSPRDAKAICNGNDVREPCPVREQCLDFALDNDERYGVWGGRSERERRRLRRDGPRDTLGRRLRRLQPCGTDPAYQRHLRDGETPCQPCREAHARAAHARKGAA